LSKIQKIIEYLQIINNYDIRQQGKIKYSLSEIIGIAFFAMAANADDCVDIANFAQEHQSQLKTIFTLKHGVPSHDTIYRTFAMLSPKYLQSFQKQFNNLLNSSEAEKMRKIFSIDGKTQCGNGNMQQNANHIVSVVDENGFCLGQEQVKDKSNEITAIPELLDSLNITGHIVTLDAMGTQRDIACKIRKKRADYVLTLKGNQGLLHEETGLCFDDPRFLGRCEYYQTLERARGGVEKREYWQSCDVKGLSARKNWVGLKSVAMTRSTVIRNGQTIVQTRYFISSLSLGVAEIARAIRGHWMVESMHWHLDVTFKEDNDHTLNKQVAFNLNIMRKLALNLLRLLDVGRKDASMNKKRHIICCNPIKYLNQLLTL